MNWIRTIIKPRYSSIVPLLILHGSIIILMNILYRVRVYSLVTEIYPDLKLNGIYEFLSLSLHHDSILIVSAILLVLCIALVFAGARRAACHSCVLLGPVYLFHPVQHGFFQGVPDRISI